MGIPAYRLSAYFNDHRGASFSDWLNGQFQRRVGMTPGAYRRSVPAKSPDSTK